MDTIALTDEVRAARMAELFVGYVVHALTTIRDDRSSPDLRINHGVFYELDGDGQNRLKERMCTLYAEQAGESWCRRYKLTPEAIRLSYTKKQDGVFGGRTLSCVITLPRRGSNPFFHLN